MRFAGRPASEGVGITLNLPRCAQWWKNRTSVPHLALPSSSKIFFQLLTVAHFQGLGKLLDCLAGDLLCLLDFHVCPPVSGSYCSLHTRPGSNPETGDKSGEMAAPRSERVAGRMTPGFCGVRRASEDRRRDELRGGARTTRSGQLGARELQSRGQNWHPIVTEILIDIEESR
jgi:hypothetical protein